MILIALGESIVIIGAANPISLTDLKVTAAVLAAFVVAFAGAVALWWLYFDQSAEAAAGKIARSEDPGRLGRSACHLIHPVMVAGIIVGAAADRLPWIPHPEDPETRRAQTRRSANRASWCVQFYACGTVVLVALDGLPDWLPAWCLGHLGGEPVGVLFQLQQISMVFGLRLDGGRDVVVKARADEGRAVSCVAAQAQLADRGFPCARPLTPVTNAGALAVHAEEFRPGGNVLRGNSPDVAVRYAEVFARLMAELAGVAVAPPLPNPRWVHWDHAGSGVWPPIGFLDRRNQSAVPAYAVEVAERVRERLLAADLPCVLGHADFEAQNLRWHGQHVWAVHDWDSLAWQPEAALAGVASGAFANAEVPTLAPIESSEAFLSAYQDIRGRLFTAAEQEIAWAASLWLAAHNARWEALHGDTPVSGDALRAQAAERIRRANA